MLFSRKNDVDFLSLLVKAAENTLHAAQVFRNSMNDTKPPVETFQEVKDLESLGDDITREIAQGLHKVFITPIDREDIMELAHKLDDVLDGIEASMARFDYLSVSTTDQYMRSFADVLVDSCQLILQAFEQLSKKKYAKITEFAEQINELENEGDRLMREGIREIFLKKKDPYEDFKLKEIYERLEQTTDVCKDVASILHSVVLRYS